jgi:hypothetical protein
MKNFFAILGLLLVCIPSGFASPLEVLIIRHGEKPDGVSDNSTGAPNAKDNGELSPKGRFRAEKLVNYFLKNPEVTKLGVPTFIFAMKQKKPGSSVRAIQTVQPLVDKMKSLNMPVTFIVDYTRDNYPDMVDHIMNDPALEGKVVLICWEHQVIPDIVSAFGYSDNSSNDESPKKWKDNSYDRTWILQRFGNKKGKEFHDIPQGVLPGDSTDVRR